MKKNLIIPFLLIVFLSTSALLQGQACIPCEINSNWQHVKAVVIDNSTNPVALTNYQLLITLDTQTPISAGDMNSDGSDIRFTTQCTNDLFYWIETGINTPATKIWVKVLPFVLRLPISQVMLY